MRSHYITLGIGAALGTALSLAIVTHNANRRGPPASRAGAEPLASSEHSSAVPGVEAQAQRAEAELGLAALRRVAFNQALSAEQVAPTQPAEDPLTAACSTLDQRLKSAPAIAAEASRLERALRGVVDSAALGTASAAITCGSTMCRVDLADAEDSGVRQAANAFVEHLPKDFASTVIYPRGTGERAMYVATRASDLELSPEPPSTAVAQTSSALPTAAR